MPLDERLNPLSTTTEQQIALLERKIDDLKGEYILFFSGETRQPPEKKREDLEIAIRKLVYGGAKTPRLDMIIQNLAQRFSLYNNMWLKRLNEMESGVPALQNRKTARPAPAPAAKPGKGPREVYLTVNDEETFERFAAAYQELLPEGSRVAKDKDALIANIKAKMLTNNLVEAKVIIAVQGGKLSLRIRK